MYRRDGNSRKASRSTQLGENIPGTSLYLSVLPDGLPVVQDEHPFAQRRVGLFRSSDGGPERMLPLPQSRERRRPLDGRCRPQVRKGLCAGRQGRAQRVRALHHLSALLGAVRPAGEINGVKYAHLVLSKRPTRRAPGGPSRQQGWTARWAASASFPTRCKSSTPS